MRSISRRVRQDQRAAGSKVAVSAVEGGVIERREVVYHFQAESIAVLARDRAVRIERELDETIAVVVVFRKTLRVKIAGGRVEAAVAGLEVEEALRVDRDAPAAL